MAEDLKILITGSLNSTASISEINKGIQQLQGKVDSLNLNIKIDDNVFNTLRDFSNQMSKIADIAKNTGKIIQESINPDGSKIKTTYYNGLNGEFSQLATAAKQAGEVQLKALDDVRGGFTKASTEAQKYNSELQKIAQTVKLTNDIGTQSRTVKMNGEGGVTGFTDTTNYAKSEKDAQDYINWWDKSLQTLQSEQTKLSDSLKRLYDSGALNQQFFDNFNKAINTTNNVEQVDRLTASLQRVSQYAKNENLQQSLLGQSQALLGSGKIVDSAGINDLITNLNRLNISEQGATRELALMQAQLRGFQSTATVASETTSTLGNVLKNMSMYFGGFMLFMQGFNAIKNGISTVNSLNQALTQISIVTYQNQQQVEALGESYNKLASQMGVTTTDITNEATELYRQGLSADQVTERMKTITEYAKISSLDTKTASEIMTAAINSMGVSAQRAADVWSFLGDQTATGADEIGKAMQKVGGTAGELKIPFELVSSWISVISSKTRLSAESIGDSVKALLARMQSLKQNGFDQTDGTQVNQVSKSLAAVGVQLVDSEGNFRNFGDVLKDLSSKWSDLTGRQKSYIATTVAGIKFSAA